MTRGRIADLSAVFADLTAWLDQKKLATVIVEGASLACSTSALGKDLTLLPLMADGLELVVLFVLIAL